MKTPTLTVGLPFYNPGPALQNAIRGVYAQTVEDWELILLNDGSTDGSAELAAKVKDPRVRLISDGQNVGLSRRLNQIALEARGPIVFRLDADDTMHPDRFRRSLEVFERDAACDVVSTGAVLIDQAMKPFGLRDIRPEGSKDVLTAFSILKLGGIVHPTIAARRSWFLENPYNPDFLRAEDRELFIRTLRKTTFQHINEALYYYFCIRNIRPAAYQASYRTERRILREYGPKEIGAKMAFYLYLRSLLKSAVLFGLSRLNLHNTLIPPRVEPISRQVLEQANRNIALVRSIQVPGLDV